MSSLQAVVVHYGSRALLVVGILVLRKLSLGRARRAQQRPGQESPRFKIIKPVEYRADNPSYLSSFWQQVALGKHDNGHATCPLVEQHKAKIDALAPSLTSEETSLKGLFALEDGTTHLNHGSYGAAFRLVLDVQSWYRDRMEAEPTRFMETEFFPALHSALVQLSDFIGVQPQDVVPMHNATSAVATVVNSLVVGPGDLVLMTTMTYPAVRSTLARFAAHNGANLLEVELNKETLSSPNSILEAFKAALQGRRRVRLAVLDHVLSFPPVVMPLDGLVPICKQAGAKVLVDGAHGIGALAPNIPQLCVEFYTSNLHKWMCTPKGTAFLWVAPEEQSRIRPLVTSHGCGLGFQPEFAWSGTDDWTGWLALPAAIAIFNQLKPNSIREHNRRLVSSAAKLLLERWGTSRLYGVNSVGYSAGMVAVELPESPGVASCREGAEQLHRTLRSRFKIEVPTFWWEGVMWVRISSHLYNTIDDYEALAKAVLELRSADCV
eukprot:evm.model.scf_1233.4 EVM.evm.TU.scf_1233.4   scf_1233:24014-35309(-)